jgi:hypothetical protein
MQTAWERYISKYGAATAIALFLVWYLASDVSGSLRALKLALDNHVSETNFYLRAICNNTATTEGQRANCIAPERR